MMYMKQTIDIYLSHCCMDNHPNFCDCALSSG